MRRELPMLSDHKLTLCDTWVTYGKGGPVLKRYIITPGDYDSITAIDGSTIRFGEGKIGGIPFGWATARRDGFITVPQFNISGDYAREIGQTGYFLHHKNP